MGIDVTICLHSVTPTAPESVSFFIPLGRARSFVIVCLSLPLPLMVSYVKAKHKSSRVATVDPPEECRTGGMGRFLDNT